MERPVARKTTGLRTVVLQLLLLFLGLSTCVQAQISNTDTQGPLQFAVATIRPVEKAGMVNMSPPGSAIFEARSMTLYEIIVWAFDIVDPAQLKNEPKWLNSARWDITARPEGLENEDESKSKMMVKELLAERFHLKYHTQTESLKGLHLTTINAGLTLSRSEGGTPDASVLLSGSNAHIHLANASMPDLATALVRILHEPVVDATRLTDRYDATIRYAPPDDPDSTSPSIFAALHDVGLKLERSTIQFPVLVFDGIDRYPTEN